MDLREIHICSDLSLLVYWKVLEIGKGPAVILKAFDKEVLKFDCFGGKSGHFHIAPNYEFRIYFCEQTIPEQINRTLAELKINGLSYLKMQAEPEIRTLNPDPDNYFQAIEEAGKLLTHFYETVPEIREITPPSTFP
jgi:hypothetical protein